VYIAEKMGFFASEGLDVTLQAHGSGKAALNSVLEGKAQLATVADTPVMFAAMSGESICVVTAIETSAKNRTLVARKDRGIAGPGDLAGKTIGVTIGTNNQYFLDAFLAKHVIGGNIIMSNLKAEEMVAALVKGDIDAASTMTPNTQLMLRALGDRGLMLTDESLYTETFCIAGKQDYVKSHPEETRRVLRALLKAEAFAKDNLGEAQVLVAEAIGVDKILISETWDRYEFAVGLSQSLLSSLESQSRWAIQSNLTPDTKVPNYTEHLCLDGLRTVKPEAVTVKE